MFKEREEKIGLLREKRKIKVSNLNPSPVVDPASGLMIIKAEFENSDQMIKPGVAGSMLVKIP